jgi:hypothetical protein
MTRGEFEKEMEYYIAQRRKAKGIPGLFGGFKPKKKMEPELPPEVQKYDETTPAEIPETMPGEEDYPEKKGFFTRLLESMGLVSAEKTDKPADVPTEEVQRMIAKDEVTQDFKEVAKIALNVVKQLPDDRLTGFKSSQEFVRLKELLKKHQLIK